MAAARAAAAAPGRAGQAPGGARPVYACLCLCAWLAWRLWSVTGLAARSRRVLPGATRHLRLIPATPRHSACRCRDAGTALSGADGGAHWNHTYGDAAITGEGWPEATALRAFSGQDPFTTFLLCHPEVEMLLFHELVLLSLYTEGIEHFGYGTCRAVGSVKR